MAGNFITSINKSTSAKTVAGNLLIHTFSSTTAEKKCKYLIISRLCNGSGIRSTALIEHINPRTVLSVLHNFELVAHKPKHKYYLFLEVAECRPDELWTYVSSKKKQVWNIGAAIRYLYCRFTGEIVLRPALRVDLRQTLNKTVDKLATLPDGLTF